MLHARLRRRPLAIWRRSHDVTIRQKRANKLISCVIFAQSLYICKKLKYFLFFGRSSLSSMQTAAIFSYSAFSSQYLLSGKRQNCRWNMEAPKYFYALNKTFKQTKIQSTVPGRYRYNLLFRRITTVIFGDPVFYNLLKSWRFYSIVAGCRDVDINFISSPYIIGSHGTVDLHI